MLELHQLTVTIDRKTVIHDLKLKLPPGELHVLMGPNGAGKSSLAQALMGHPQYQLSPSSKLILDQNDLTHATPDERARHGLFLSFQHPLEIDGISVQNFLKSAYEAIHCQHCQPDHCPRLSVSQFRQMLSENAKTLNIPSEFLSRSLGSGFSGGEKKRLEMLQLLVLKPRYAILDEPDSGLDVDTLKLVASTIEQVRAQNQTGILLITHYRRLLDHLKPDKVNILIKGRLVKTGNASLINTIDEAGYRSLSK